MFRFGPIACFRVLLLVGVFCVFVSGVTYVVSHFTIYLDSVLTPAELKDPAMVAKANRFLEKLPTRALRSTAVVCFVVGLINIAVSFRGLYAIGAAELRAAERHGP